MGLAWPRLGWDVAAVTMFVLPAAAASFAWLSLGRAASYAVLLVLGVALAAELLCALEERAVMAAESPRCARGAVIAVQRAWPYTGHSMYCRGGAWSGGE
ncbi:MAG: hypothetical protein ABW252_03685 [Polyangiales bacterium]